MVSKESIFNLVGKVAAVTGGGSGLGREFCEILAEYGADIVCMDVRMERAAETCAFLEKQYGRKAVPLEVDVSQYDQVKAAFLKVANDFGKLDILVNNAGVMSPPKPVHEIDVDQWHKLFGVNLHGTFYCMKEALPIMLKNQKGSIITLSSVSGVLGIDPTVQCTSHYITSKSGVIGLTRQAAAEYGQYNIRVNSIAPGWHRGTRLAKDAGISRTPEFTQNFEALLASRTPMRRMGETYELKGLLLFLASDASSFVTGQIIAHDGGWTCCH